MKSPGLRLGSSPAVLLRAAVAIAVACGSPEESRPLEGTGGATEGTGGATGLGCEPVLPVGGVCNPDTGYGAPLSTCSPEDPCTKPLASTPGPITEPTEIPVCRTTNAKYPSFDDGAPTHHPGVDGTERYACEFTPEGTSTASKRPLLLFFHGSGGTADDVYNSTLLRQKAESYDLQGDPSSPGFVLVSVQGRNLHWPNDTPQDGTKHDTYYRDLSSCSTNPDFAEADRRIDDWVASGLVDPNRIGCRSSPAA